MKESVTCYAINQLDQLLHFIKLFILYSLIEDEYCTRIKQKMSSLDLYFKKKHIFQNLCNNKNSNYVNPFRLLILIFFFVVLSPYTWELPSIVLFEFRI